MIHTLYGDGIHDDTAAIQERIDHGGCEVCLPPPEACYLISAPLQLPSNFRLVLPRYAEIRLADGANCVMLQNRLEPTAAPGSDLFGYLQMYSGSDQSKNIEVCGGIWNCNNLGQLPNPIQTHDDTHPGYYGFGMLFYRVNGLKLSGLTIKDPTNFGITLDTVCYFTASDITFDFNGGNPMRINMDGLHFCGNCHFGTIRNLQGACYDDLVALNAHEGTLGPISDITIDGIFAEECHSAVRLLAADERVERIHISNVFGTYYQYCIGITNYYYLKDAVGVFDAITLEHIYASKAVRYPHLYPHPDSYVYALIWVDTMTRTESLLISDLQRREFHNPIATILISAGAQVEQLVLENISTENHTGKDMPLLVKEGTVQELISRNIQVDHKPYRF